MSSILYYCICASWFAVYAITTALIPTLAFEIENPSSARIGVLQAVFFLSTILVLLPAGKIADEIGYRALLLAGPALGIATCLVVVLVGLDISPGLAIGALALGLGLGGGLLTPSREALLADVSAGQDLRRFALVATILQFLGQIGGFAAIGLYAEIGAQSLLLLVAGLLSVIALSSLGIRVKPKTLQDPPRLLTPEVPEFAKEPSPGLIIAVLAGGIVGVCFVGVSLVLIPFTVYDLLGGNSADFAVMNIVFVSGTLATILLMLMNGQRMTSMVRLTLIGIIAGGLLLPVMPTTQSLFQFGGVLALWGALRVSLWLQDARPSINSARPTPEGAGWPVTSSCC